MCVYMWGVVVCMGMYGYVCVYMWGVVVCMVMCACVWVGVLELVGADYVFLFPTSHFFTSIIYILYSIFIEIVDSSTHE